MIIISMQYFGKGGAGSKKSGGGARTVNATPNNSLAQEYEGTAAKTLRQAELLEADIAERQRTLALSGMNPNSKKYKAIEADIDERIERAKKLRQEAQYWFNQAAQL